MTVRGLLVAVLALSLASGCARSTTREPDAATTAVDAAAPRPDASRAVDGGRELTHVGAPCGADTECGDEGVCRLDYPDGYCTAECRDRLVGCGSAAECVTGPYTMGYGQCLSRCDPAAPVRECRARYACVGGVCVPGCTDDSDCSDGGRCDVARHGCFDPDAAPWDACTSDEDCNSDTRCRTEDTGYPGGLCIRLGLCEQRSNTGCPGDGQCVPGGICMDGCAMDSDCRDGYRCGEVAATVFRGRFHCIPACTSHEQCAITGRCDVETGRCTT